MTSCVARALHRFGDSLGNGWEPVLDVLETTCRTKEEETATRRSPPVLEASCPARGSGVGVARSRTRGRGRRGRGSRSRHSRRVRRASGASDGARRARSTTTTRRGRGRGTGRSPRSSTSRACRSKLASGAVVNAWTTATWSATCDAFRELARDDDDAIDALFALLNDDESERLREDAWAEAKTRAIEASLQTTVDAAHACRRIAPRVIALIRDRRAAYEALLPTVWAFAGGCVLTQAPPPRSPPRSNRCEPRSTSPSLEVNRGGNTGARCVKCCAAA